MAHVAVRAVQIPSIWSATWDCVGVWESHVPGAMPVWWPGPPPGAIVTSKPELLLRAMSGVPPQPESVLSPKVIYKPGVRAATCGLLVSGGYSAPRVILI